MIALIWRYEVLDEARSAFEATYAPTGAWAQLFARAEGFRGTELFRAEDGSYLTLDIWNSRADFEAFLAAHRDAYEALDRKAPRAGPRASTGSANMRCWARSSAARTAPSPVSSSYWLSPDWPAAAGSS